MVGFAAAAAPTCWTTWALPVRVVLSPQGGGLTLGTRLRGGRTHLGIGCAVRTAAYASAETFACSPS